MIRLQNVRQESSEETRKQENAGEEDKEEAASRYDEHWLYSARIADGAQQAHVKKTSIVDGNMMSIANLTYMVVTDPDSFVGFKYYVKAGGCVQCRRLCTFIQTKSS